MIYRKEIDGLRALAVIPVVLYHAGFGLFSGGFLGVDVFFVISGYLITTIILDDFDNDNFSILKFYQRRIRRILPVLILVIIFCTFFSFILMTRTEIGIFSQSVISTIFFFSNFFFWKTSPYFQSESELIPLLHTWSLSIEEQFYLFFPLVLIIIYKINKKYIFITILSGTIISFLICLYLSLKSSGVFNFYFTFSRAWEIGAGCLTACLIKNYHKKNYIKLNSALSFLGILLILFSFIFLSKDQSHPSMFTLIPIIGTILIIVFADEGTLVKKILSTKILVFIGLISYSLYLWHQPLFVFSRLYSNYDNFLLKIVLIIISVILSILSYYYVEKRFRDKKKINTKTVYKIIFTLILTLLSFHVMNSKTFSNSSKNGTEAQLAKILSNTKFVNATRLDERQFIKYRILYQKENPDILVIGSSRAMEIGSEMLKSKSLNLSVSGASIEDHIAITGMALNKLNIKKIILGADPWLFNKYSNQNRWKSIGKDYFYILTEIENNNFIKDIYKNSSDKKKYFYEYPFVNIYNLLNIRSLNRKLDNNKKLGIIYKDGRRLPNKNEKKLKIKGRVIKYSMDPYEFSYEKYDLYKKFIYYLKTKYNIEIILFLTPYYETSYNLSIKDNEFYIYAEDKFKLLAKQLKIKILGSFDPSINKCKKNEFHDDYHPNRKCISKILDNF
jgi:peptidoglycan/LPS O-acetylase OafA/YrhL